ncbi:uncharacterized CRM domain-containing protein At3g25440, chloroplastic-like [Actinidia eriantha]|uniref:uncharacterized CRM domain-containing protein At3g25440, chloroplastic-like n=1 Tax=Actinidia eriantha TaxID=165200 RepID=UPI00258409AF|nr:uncharacterized CRM domain-containing protein At3g25440, chloroplastic-like [Actinidia eriantha]
MANPLIRKLRRSSLSSLLNLSLSKPIPFRSIYHHPESIFDPFKPQNQIFPSRSRWLFRNLSHGSVHLVISQGKPKFETREIDPPRKEKWKTKKRLKQQRKREKQKRKAANKRDPRRICIKGKKKKFANAEERIKCKLEKAKIKEAMLIERLKRYEVPKLQGPVVKPHDLTGEERFYLKKMGQKGSNYAPVGRRGIFGGVILNMHMHWKKHETVKVICKPCKPGQVHEYADEISRLSGGIPIQILGDDTIIFYRGKNYVQPQVMSPIDTLSKKRALEKSKYEQSLESVRHFIAIAEKELELYYRHIALYGDLNNQSPNSFLDDPKRGTKEPERIGNLDSTFGGFSPALLEAEIDSRNPQLSETEDDSGDEDLSVSETDVDDDNIPCNDFDSCDEVEDGSSSTEESSTDMLGSSLVFKSKCDAYNQEFLIEN